MKARGALSQVRRWIATVESPIVREKLLELEEVLHVQISMHDAKQGWWIRWWLGFWNVPPKT